MTNDKWKMINDQSWGRGPHYLSFTIYHFEESADFVESLELELAPLHGALGCQVEGFRDDLLNPLLKPFYLPLALAEQVQNAPAHAGPLFAVEHRLDQAFAHLFV